MDLDGVEMEVNTSTSGSSNPETDSESDEIPDAGALNSDDSDTPYVYKHRVHDGIAPARTTRKALQLSSIPSQIVMRQADLQAIADRVALKLHDEVTFRGRVGRRGSSRPWRRPDLNSDYVRNYPTAPSTANGPYRAPNIVKNHFGPIRLPTPDPDPRLLTHEEQVSTQQFENNWCREGSNEKIADKLFRQWKGWESATRLRDLKAGKLGSEKIWVKERLQLRWRVWLQAVPETDIESYSCRRAGCGKKLESGTVIVSFEPPEWTQLAETMERKLKMKDWVVKAHTIQISRRERINTEASEPEGMDVVTQQGFVELERGLLTVKTCNLPRWSTDDWSGLWEPDYNLLRTKLLSKQYGKGKFYCINCFELLLPPVHRLAQSKRISGGSIGSNTITTISVGTQTPIPSIANRRRADLTIDTSLTAPKAGSVTEVPTPTSMPSTIKSTKPVSLAPTGRILLRFSSNSLSSYRSNRDTPARLPVPSLEQKLEPNSLPKIVLLVNGKRPQTAGPRPDAAVSAASLLDSQILTPPPTSIPREPSPTVALTTTVASSSSRTSPVPEFLADVEGDPTINPWTGIHSSVFPDTRGKYAVSKDVRQKLWAWKAACCDLEDTKMRDPDNPGEPASKKKGKKKQQKRNSKELGEMGLGEVLKGLVAKSVDV